MLVLIAAEPNWAEGVTAIAAVIAAAGVVLAWIQLRIQAEELRTQAQEIERATRIREAQRALDLMRPLIELERVVVDHPKLGPYFHSADGAPLVPPPKPGADDELRAQVIAHATAYINHAEAVGWQTRVMRKPGRTDWTRLFHELYRNNPAIREVVDAKKHLLSPRTRKLFGVESE